MRFHAMLRMLVFFVLATSFSVVQANDLLKQAQQLINQEKSGQAYALLLAEYESHAGSPQFDLLLGIAALNAGEPTQAVFALERVLALEPENARARAELARA